MNRKALVAYASKYGSTQEVADAVAAALRQGGFLVDFQHVKKVRELEPYDFIVLGAPIYLGSLHKDASNFLTRNQKALTVLSAEGNRVAIFALGPTHNDEKEWQDSRSMLEKELAKYPWLSPLVVEMFGGKYDPAKLRFPDNLIEGLPASPLHGMPASDVRDWTAIRLWASSLVQRLQSLMS